MRGESIIPGDTYGVKREVDLFGQTGNHVICCKYHDDMKFTRKNKIMLDIRQISSLSDFVRNPKLHVARLLLDAKTYEELVAHLSFVGPVAAVRAIVRKAESAGPREEVSEAETERSNAVMQ